MQMLIARPYVGKSVVLSRLWNEQYSREVDGSGVAIQLSRGK